MDKVVKKHIHGFTGHEHYADLKIINMNGRLYDPVIARFFSPDNFVQAPECTQSYNRYSYCLNNPLQWVDPSGEDMLDPWYRDAIGIVRWTDSEFNMPIGGFFLGDEGVFTSDGEMRYYYADGRISNLKLPQVLINWGGPNDYAFSFPSAPMQGAGFYRIGDPSEQTGSYSCDFQFNTSNVDVGLISNFVGVSSSIYAEGNKGVNLYIPSVISGIAYGKQMYDIGKEAYNNWPPTIENYYEYVR